MTNNPKSTNDFNLKSIFASIHAGNIVNTVKSYAILLGLAGLDIFGVVLAFKASILLGILTLVSGPAFLVSMLAISQRGGYNFWNKFMPFVSAFVNLALWAIIVGAVALITTGLVGSSFIWLWLAVYLATFAVFGYLTAKFLQDSLYETFFMVFFTLSPVGFIFGLMNWWLGLNLASYLVKLFH